MKFISILSIVFCCSVLNAQHSIGFKFGGINSKIYQSSVNSIKTERLYETIENSFYSGLAFGLIYNYRFSKLFSIQPEINYMQMGTWYEFKAILNNDTVFYISQKLRLNYLMIPILAKFSVGNKNLKGHLAIGPYLGVLLNGSAKNYANWFGTYTNEEKPIDFDKATISRLDYGLVFSPSVSYKFGLAELFLEYRFMFGLHNLSTFQDKSSINSPKPYNRMHQISIGLLFNLGKK
ncbi:MAG: PorT family protein [Bacteroidetes bacterium]|nr:MAG: PorT family protein [Bacteroidota bacterium]